MAGRGGFEPPEVLPSPVFKTGTFDHSDISRTVKKLSLTDKMEEPAGLEPANSSFAGCGLTNLAMVPSSWRSHPGFKPGDHSVASLLPYHLAMTPSIRVVPGAGLEPARSQ